MERIFKERFIDFMIDSGVLTFGEFQTKSGRMSPYFINTGNYSTGKKIALLGGYYSEFITQNLPSTLLESGSLCLFGPAYKGIPLVVSVCGALYGEHHIDVPYAFNRKEGKDHGEKGVLVGHSFQPGQSVLIVEDVITAGTAMRDVIPFLVDQGDIKIEGVVVSVDRMEKGNSERSAIEEIQEEYGIPVYSLVTIRDILEKLEGETENISSKLSEGTLEKIKAYLDKYGV